MVHQGATSCISKLFTLVINKRLTEYVYAEWIVSQSFLLLRSEFGRGKIYLPPLPFSEYSNDFKSWVDGASSGLNDISAMVGSRASDQSDLDTLFEMSVLMYANDTLLSDSENIMGCRLL